MILTLLSMIAAVACYAIKELAAHGKLMWNKENPVWGFWGGTKSWMLKYELDSSSMLILSPNTWYYRFFKIKYKERWPTSATLTVFLTDGYHHMQFWFFNFLSLSLTFAIGFNWWLLLVIWSLIHVVHFVTYRLLQR